jgi:GlpG protein
VVSYKPHLMLAGIVALVVAGIVPLFWCPWSVTWLTTKAYRAHVAERYEEAVDLYTRVIQRDANNAWAYHNRSLVHEALGDLEAAHADLDRARHLDPSIEGRKEDGAP